MGPAQSSCVRLAVSNRLPHCPPCTDACIVPPPHTVPHYSPSPSLPRLILDLLNIIMPSVSSIDSSTTLHALAAGGSSDGEGVDLTVVYSAASGTLPVYESVPDYSSYGPTADGRIKPDIVAPGVCVCAGASLRALL